MAVTVVAVVMGEMEVVVAGKGAGTNRLHVWDQQVGVTCRTRPGPTGGPDG